MKKLPDFWIRNDLHVADFILTIILLVFQNPLARIWSPFSYMDEIAALWGVIYSGWILLTGKQTLFSRKNLFAMACLGVFVTSGLLGSVLYRYQPWKSVIIDLYTNVKFFFAVNAGFAAVRDLPWETARKKTGSLARFLTCFLFLFFLVDRVLRIYDGEVRYGIRSAALFYTHPTYFAGAVVFLLCLKTAFYEKKSRMFLLMDLVMIAFTLRSKAIVSTMVFAALWVYLVIWKKKMHWYHLVLMGIFGAAVAWPQIHYYFFELANWSARSVLLITSLKIMRDYFPIGTGFGTYASAEAAKHYSPVYVKYGFQNNWELRNVADKTNTQRLIRMYDIPRDNLWGGPYLHDSFWPIIFGQTGVLGTVAYIAAQARLAQRCWQLKKVSFYSFATVLYIWFHLLICSAAEPAFNNPTAVPLALVMGMVLCEAERTTKDSSAV